MKKLSFSFLALFFLLTFIGYAQSIHFTSPTNGQVVTGTGYGSTESAVPLNLTYSYQLSNDPNRIGMYIKLFPSPYATEQSNQGSGITQWWYLPSGAYTWRIELYETYLEQGSLKRAEQTITFYVKYNIQSLNNFGGGLINVDGQQRTHGYTTPKLTGESLQVGAIDQLYYNIFQLWNQSGTNNSIWQRKGKNQTEFSNIYGATSRNYNYTVASNDNGAQIRAAMRKIVKPNFQNNFVGVGNGGVIKVNNTQYNSPTAQFDVVELNPITATAVWQVINEIEYTFDHWSDASTIATKTFYPENTTVYTAYYTGKPSTINRNLHTGLTYNQPIVLYWNEHPNSNVTQYQIWRKVKHNGIMGSAYLIGTRNRGTTSFTDYEYALTRGYTDDLIYYDVRPYYSTENSYSDPNWFAVYGEIQAKPSDSTNYISEIKNSISNHPNPFNPVTNIRYSIKESGLVNIKVFDLLGQQIAELINDEMEAGSYSISFDASNLPSGIYLYTINSKNFMQTRKMLLMK